MEIQAAAPAGEKSLLDRAGEAYQAKDYDQALLLLDQVILAEPENAAPWFYKGMVCGDQGRFQDALAALDRAAELDPSATNEETFLFRRGVALGEVGRHAEALESSERALERMTDQSPLRELRGVAMFRIGLAQANLGKLAEADDSLRRALELWPSNLPRASALTQRSKILVQLGRFQDCLATLEELFRLDPAAASNIQLWALHRSSLMGLGRLEEAKAEPPEPLKDHPFTLAVRGSALNLLGRLDEAAPLLAKAGEPGPQYDGDFLAWLGAGMANVGLARAEKALSALDRARAIQPTFERVTVSMLRGLALSWLGRTNEAMEEVRDLPPVDFVVLIRGTALAESGDIEAALKAFDQAIATAESPDRPNHLIATMAWTRKGQLLLKKGQKEEALSACRRAVETAAALPPKEVNRLAALINLGVALWRNDKVDEALDTLREPTRLWSELPGEVPNRGLGWWMIGEILETQERREEALQAYERGAAVEPSSHAIQFSMGHVLYELEDYESAEKACQRAWDSANTPQEKFDALVLRGFAQSKQEHYEDAIRSYREAVALLPGEFSREWKLWVGLGEAYQASGRSGAALRAFQQGWRKDRRKKKSSALAVAISGALLDLKQDDKALEFLEKEAGENAKEDPSGRLAFNYGVALYRARRKALARSQWKVAAAKGFPAAKDFLEKLEKGGPSTSAWLEYWFGDVTPGKRRIVGALLVTGALVVALLPMVKKDVVPGLNTGQDWNVMALTVAAFLALLALPVVGSLSFGPLKLDGVRSEASPGGGGAVDEELDKAIRSGVSSLATAGTGAGRSLQPPSPRIGPGGLGS